MVRLAELMGTLSLATDAGMGMPAEHGLRAAAVAARLGEIAGQADPEGGRAEGTRPVAVAGATRTNGTAEPRRGPRHVVLTESQVSLAHSLGLTNEQYAMQLVRDEGRQEGSYHDISTKRQ